MKIKECVPLGCATGVCHGPNWPTTGPGAFRSEFGYAGGVPGGVPRPLVHLVEMKRLAGRPGPLDENQSKSIKIKENSRKSKKIKENT